MVSVDLTLGINRAGVSDGRRPLGFTFIEFASLGVGSNVKGRRSVVVLVDGENKYPEGIEG